MSQDDETVKMTVAKPKGVSPRFDLKTWLDRHVIPLFGVAPSPPRQAEKTSDLPDNGATPSSIVLHSVLQQDIGKGPGGSPSSILVFAKAHDPNQWADIAKAFLEGKRGTSEVAPQTELPLGEKTEGRNSTSRAWAFDYLRDHVPLVLEGKKVLLFGGDGTPIFNQHGESMVRLVKQLPHDQGPGTLMLILELGALHDPPKAAAGAVKRFYELFLPETPFDVCARFRPPFGA